MKRKCIAWLMILSVLMTVGVPLAGLAAAPANANESTSTGSASLDEANQRITLADLVLAARCFRGQTELTPEQTQKLDPNNDGRITLSELVMLAQRYAAQQSVPGEPTPSASPSETESLSPDAPAAPSSEPSETTSPDTTGIPSATPVPTSTPLPTADPSGRVLVVYYSATGSTRRVAELVAEEAGADLVLSLEPVQPYTREDLNYNDPNSRVSQEHSDPALRSVPLLVDTVEDWEMYDTVFVGYPIWWGIAAWPVDGFLTANDFADKVVVPFCTSGSSDIGQSANLLEQTAGGGTWLPGRRFPSSVSQETVGEWVSGLNVKV